MTFTKGNHTEKLTFKLKNTNIENVKEYRGVLISKKNCSFQPNLKEFNKKGLKAVFALNSKIKLTPLPVKVALNIFDAAVLPILLYGSEIWEPYLNQDRIRWKSNDIEKVHTQDIKRILGLNRSTTNILVRAEVGRFSLQTKALQRNIKYIKYLRSKSNDELAKHAL